MKKLYKIIILVSIVRVGAHSKHNNGIPNHSDTSQQSPAGEVGMMVPHYKLVSSDQIELRDIIGQGKTDEWDMK